MDPQPPSSTGAMYWYPREEGKLFRTTPAGCFPQVGENVRFIVVVVVIVVILQLIVVSICINWKSWGHALPSGDHTVVSWTEECFLIDVAICTPSNSRIKRLPMAFSCRAPIAVGTGQGKHILSGKMW